MQRSAEKIDIRGLSREEWLALRRQGIGGSDAGAILGYNRYRGPYCVWEDKLGGEAEDQDNEAMRQGRDLEEYVAKRFCESTGKRVQRSGYMYKSKAYPWMLANVDRRIVGENAGLECKTSKDIYLSRYKDGAYPEEYYCQCLHYLAVTGLDAWYLAVLVYGTDLLVFRIDRDEEEIDALVKQEERFWKRHVLERVPPIPDGLQNTSDALLRVHPAAGAQYIDCPNPDLMEEYTCIRAEIDALDQRKKALANQIKGMIGDNEGMGSNTHIARWINQRKASLDKAALLRDYPSIRLDQYTSFKESRTLHVKEMEDSQWKNC